LQFERPNDAVRAFFMWRLPLSLRDDALHVYLRKSESRKPRLPLRTTCPMSSVLLTPTANNDQNIAHFFTLPILQ